MSHYNNFHFLMLLSMHIISFAMDAEHLLFNRYDNEKDKSKCAIADKGRFIAIDTEDKSVKVSFNAQNNMLIFNDTCIKNINFNCFATVQSTIKYCLRINEHYYVNGSPINLDLIACDDSNLQKYPILLKNLNIPILAPLCTFKEDADLESIVNIEAPRNVLRLLHIKEYTYPDSLKVKYIHILPQNGVAFSTEKPIMCYVPVGTQTFPSYEQYVNRSREK